MDEALRKMIALLNEAFSERHNSVAQYILHSEPRANDEEVVFLEDIQRIAKFDEEESSRLSRLIDRMGGVPKVVPVPARVAELNYLSIRYLHSVLRKELSRELTKFQALLPEAEDWPQVHEALAGLCNRLAKQMALLRET